MAEVSLIRPSKSAPITRVALDLSAKEFIILIIGISYTSRLQCAVVKRYSYRDQESHSWVQGMCPLLLMYMVASKPTAPYDLHQVLTIE